MAKKGRRATHEERIAAVEMLRRGISADQVADVLTVSRASVFAWMALYRQSGHQALSTKRASGRPPALSEAQRDQLARWICRDPRQLQFDFGLWTRRMVADLIERKFGLRLSAPTVGRILSNLGFSPQRPTY
ncbi:MAG: helix-turn-helix domain-containing protein, partial [Mycobacteriales bacterium]